VESSFSNYFFTVDYVVSAVVLYFIPFVYFITITFNFKRIKSLKKCNTWNTQGKTTKLSTVYCTFTKRLAHKTIAKLIIIMLQKQIRNF